MDRFRIIACATTASTAPPAIAWEKIATWDPVPTNILGGGWHDSRQKNGRPSGKNRERATACPLDEDVVRSPSSETIKDFVQTDHRRFTPSQLASLAVSPLRQTFELLG